MITHHKSLIIMAVSASISIVGAHAQPTERKPVDPKVRMSKLDTDKNGSVSAEEFAAKAKKPEVAQKRFGQMDTNKDGSLSLEELSAAPAPKKPAGQKTDAAATE
ncbi:MAG: hypothetical protein ACO3YO_09660 [Chthoniobacterales bacterium]|jgi:hypothetical protein